MLECVLNISEGRDGAAIETIAARAEGALLDLHRDPHHHRSVLTLVGIEPARAVASAAVEHLDLRDHDGVHPRLGVVDVVPFVSLGSTPPSASIDARNGFSAWMGRELGVPCFRYGPERTLPEVRRAAFDAVVPDTGPPRPHPSAGATCVGARGVLVAYNVWLAEADLDLARSVARDVRGAAVRALGLAVGDRVQVSMNLVVPDQVGPAAALDAVAARAEVAGAELVGLLPGSTLRAVPRARWEELDLAEDRTIEARAEERGIRW